MFKPEDACNTTLEAAEHSKAAQTENELVPGLEALSGYPGGMGGKISLWHLLTVAIAAGILGWNVFMCLFLPLGHEA